MKTATFMATLQTLIDQAPRIDADADTRLVFLSDLHMGDGGKRDEFRKNAALVASSLTGKYLTEGYGLVLNGDIEELYKFKLRQIQTAWQDMYDIFRAFERTTSLTKIIGNHDLGLLLHEEYDFRLQHALRIERKDGTLLAFHGHQAYDFFMKYNYLSDFLVRYMADPLKIKSADLPMTSKRRFRAERLIYRASRELGVVTIAGHTHRPLFESFSKYDTLRWNIETLLRRYTTELSDERQRTEELIGIYAAEFRELSKKERKTKVSRSLYEREDLLVPSMFNSGCATGKDGYTAMEIAGDTISLVYWTAAGKAKPYIEREAVSSDQLDGTPWVRYVVASDSLEHILARTRLL